MLRKTEQKIIRFLTDNTDFADIEDKLLESKSDEINDDELMEIVHKLEELLIGQAYLEGYKDGLEVKTKENFKRNIVKELDLNDYKKLKSAMEVN